MLVVDDDPEVLTMTRVILERYGYAALVAADAAVAETLFASQAGKIQAVISELRISGESGYALINRFAARAPSLPILFVHSGSGSDCDLPPPNEATFLAKPFAASELAAALRQAIDAAPPR